MRLGLVLSVVGVAALTVAAAPDAATPARVDCHEKTLTFLFWPNGHPAISAVRFPFFPHPHVEIYRASGRSYPNRDQIGLVVFDVNGTTGGGFSQGCGRVPTTAVDSSGATATTTAATALVCTFSAPGELEYTKTRRSITLRAVVPAAARARLAVAASLAKGGSVLRYDRRVCHPTPPPG